MKASVRVDRQSFGWRVERRRSNTEHGSPWESCSRRTRIVAAFHVCDHSIVSAACNEAKRKQVHLAPARRCRLVIFLVLRARRICPTSQRRSPLQTSHAFTSTATRTKYTAPPPPLPPCPDNTCTPRHRLPLCCSQRFVCMHAHLSLQFV